MRILPWLCGSCLLSSIAVSNIAMAQDLAVAEALFNKGLADMEAGKYNTGCPAIAESYRLDPRAGTKFTLAECEAKAGKVATASAHYEDYLQMFSRMSADQKSKQRGRDAVAAQKKAELLPQIPQLTLVLPPDAPKGTRVTRDEVELSGPAIGLPLPVDPGEHTVTTQVPGGEPHVMKFNIAKAEKKEIKLELQLAPTLAAVVPPPTASNSTATTSAPNTHNDVSTGNRKTLIYVTGGLGLAAIAAGSVTGFLALSQKSVIDDNCNEKNECNSEGIDAVDTAQTMGLVSTIGFGVGLAGVATSVVLYLTQPRKEPTRTGSYPSLGFYGDGVHMTGVQFQGSW